MEKVRFGIVGAGNQGTYYSNGLFKGGKIENAVLTAVCDYRAEKLDAIKEKYENEYHTTSESVNVVFEEVEYSSKYSYITDSSAFDKNYVYTDYTIDNGKVVMVTYSNGTDDVVFLLNYNSFPVTVRLGEGREYNLSKYDYIRLDKEVQ